MRELFLLDPDVVFLNHGSFGACPIPVFETYQNWQRELERQPVEFLGRRIHGLLDQSRVELAAYVHTAPENLIYIVNATAGINTVARSLKLQPGDQVLTTDHEYGACDNTWTFICELTGAELVREHIPMPLPEDDEIVERLWAGVTPRTRVIFLSHITSVTGLIFPVQEICNRARQAGIITIIDGAHVPGQIPLDLDALGVDFYTGNCHKWLCAPKGSAFLYARPEHHALLHPLIISWGYTDFAARQSFSKSASFAARVQWLGTLDPAAWLTVPTAIEFQQICGWDEVRRECHALAVATQARLSEVTGQPPMVRENAYAQMLLAQLPDRINPLELKTRLYDEYRVEIPISTWYPITGDRKYFIRASFQGYNTRADADALITALTQLLN